MKRWSTPVGWMRDDPEGEYVEHDDALDEIASLRARAEKAEADRDDARRFGEDAAAKYNALIASGPTLTCAFCGEAFPPGTPASQHEALTAHVGKCEKHPMRKAEAALALAHAECRAWHKAEDWMLWDIGEPDDFAAAKREFDEAQRQLEAARAANPLPEAPRA